jgi:hypothetical protein
MRISEGFVLREVAGQAVVIAVGEASEKFHGMINLNDTGKCIWQGIQEGMLEKEIVKKITDQYEVDPERAENDVKQMVQKMYEVGVIEA